MACLLSLRFFTPLSSPQTLIKEVQPRMEDGERFLIPATSVTVINLIAPRSWGGAIFCVKSCHNHILAHSRHCSEPVSPINNGLIERYCTRYFSPPLSSQLLFPHQLGEIRF